MAWMEERHHRADHILCVVSRSYLLNKAYSDLERRGALWAAQTTRPNFLLPVVIEACELPTLFAPTKRCDLHGVTEDEARALLKTFVSPAAKPPPGPFPGGKGPLLTL
jgi:hypothetical protein